MIIKSNRIKVNEIFIYIFEQNKYCNKMEKQTPH